MKTINFIGIITALLFTVKPSIAQDDGYYNENRNDDAKVVINNYYDSHGTDYYYSSRINRFHRSYAVFDYYSPVFTDTYWYDYRPWSWGISIYGNGIGFRFGFGYSPYYYDAWYDPVYYYPYYYDPYYYDPFYWRFYPRYYSYWYAPSFCWGFRHLWAHLTWSWYRPFWWHHHWFDNDYRYYSYHSNYNHFNDRYRSEYSGNRYEASRHDVNFNKGNESRRGISGNNSSVNSRNYERLNHENGLRNNESRRVLNPSARNESIIRNNETRRSYSPSNNNSREPNAGQRSYSGSRTISPADSRRSSNSGRIAENMIRSGSPNRYGNERAYRPENGSITSRVRRSEEGINQNRAANYGRSATGRRQGMYDQPDRTRNTYQPSSGNSAYNKVHSSRSMPQSISRSSNNYRSHSVDMGRISRPSGQSISMSASVRSSGSISRPSSSVSHGHSSGGMRSSGSGYSGSSGNSRRR